MDDVLILGGVKDGSLDLRTLELLGAGKKLARDLGAGLSLVLLGDAVSATAEQAATCGPDQVYILDHPLLKGFNADLWLASLEQACRKINPDVFLMSHSFIGMELGPRLACRLDTRLSTDCIDLSIDPEDGLLLLNSLKSLQLHWATPLTM